MGRPPVTKILILGKTWRVRVLSGDAFKRKHDGDARGITDPCALEIDFAADEFTLKTVRHELFHAYIEGSCVSSAKLTGEQMEELAAEIIADHGPRMMRQAQWLYRELKDEAA